MSNEQRTARETLEQMAARLTKLTDDRIYADTPEKQAIWLALRAGAAALRAAPAPEGETRLRRCACADPENCREVPPGYQCRKAPASPGPTPDLETRADTRSWCSVAPAACLWPSCGCVEPGPTPEGRETDWEVEYHAEHARSKALQESIDGCAQKVQQLTREKREAQAETLREDITDFRAEITRLTSLLARKDEEHGYAIKALDAAALWEPERMTDLADTIERKYAVCEAQWLRTIARRLTEARQRAQAAEAESARLVARLAEALSPKA